MNLVGTTRRFRRRAADSATRYERRDRTAAPFDYFNCGSWASAHSRSGSGGGGLTGPMYVQTTPPRSAQG